MKSKNVFILLVLFMSLFSASAFAGTCAKCNGRGVILISNPPVSHFGVPRKIGDCSVCGNAIFQGESHRHTTCPSCNGTGSSSAGSSYRSTSGSGYSSNDHYDGALYPDEYVRVETLSKMLYQGKTEIRRCSTCNGTGRCPGPGLHHYGNMSGMLDLDSPMPMYCPLCNGWGTCPNRNCVGGTESYTRPCTESEKAEINMEIKSIYDRAYQR